MKIKHKLTPIQLSTGSLTKQEILALHASLLAYNERVPTSQDKNITYYHYNENNIRYILSRSSEIMSESFNLIDRLTETVEWYEQLLNDPLFKMIKEEKDKISKLEEENEILLESILLLKDKKEMVHIEKCNMEEYRTVKEQGEQL